MIGVGNPLRRDDGAGYAVIEQLLTLGLSRTITTMQHHGEGLSLLEIWQEFSEVIIIDATRSRNYPGFIQRFQINYSTTLPTSLFHYSSHAFGLAEAVALAQSLRCLPHQLTIFGIEGKEFSFGQGLTPAVQAAVASLAEQIKLEFMMSESG